MLRNKYVRLFITSLIVLLVRFPLMLILLVVSSITGAIHDYSVLISEWLDESLDGFERKG